ncbi:MAG TPA: carotenoid oxygenase family protein [Leptolyngbyaceae cyanobacterium M33_DOE_097]|nr:carotenoid oxygenase family protein [Leptolyngbyaceae cyanobacterium M33_DOE_097]
MACEERLSALCFIAIARLTFGLCPRYDSKPAQKLEAEPCFVFHHANAFELPPKDLRMNLCLCPSLTAVPKLMVGC